MKLVVVNAIACSVMLLALPSCGIPSLRPAQPGPALPPDDGPPDAENSSQLGIREFYTDPLLTCLIEKALADNRELKNLNEEVQIAGNEILARSGAYLPFISVAAGAGLQRVSRFTIEGAGLIDDPFLPGKFFTNPHGNYGAGINLSWQLDIYRQLRNARDAAGQRYAAAAERRNYFVTTLVAEIAEQFYTLMGLDKRLENLDQIIEFQQKSLKFAEARKLYARGDQLAVLRFQAEVRRNQSEKLIVNQDIVVAENRINYLVNRLPQPVLRDSAGFYDLVLHSLSVGVPSQLLRNRPDIRQAERELTAAGLDVRVARINFFPQLVITGGTGLDAFNLKHLFEPQAVVGSLAGGLVAPFVNKRAIQAQYLTANARQLQAIYTYQRTILNAFTEVINRMSMVEKYTESIRIKKLQLESLNASVEVASNLFQQARTEYIDVLLAQRDLRDARVALIDAKTQQLTAVADAYQALGGGVVTISMPPDFRGQFPYTHTVRAGENLATISMLYYQSGRYWKALGVANKLGDPDHLPVGTQIIIPRPNQLDPALIEDVAAPAPAIPEKPPTDKPATVPPPPPPPENTPAPFSPDPTAAGVKTIFNRGRSVDNSIMTTGNPIVRPPSEAILPPLPVRIEDIPSAAPPLSGMMPANVPALIPPPPMSSPKN